LGQSAVASRAIVPRSEPGSAKIANFGIGLCRMKAAYCSTTAATSAGSPSMGICRGQTSVGQRASRS